MKNNEAGSRIAVRIKEIAGKDIKEEK